MLGGSTPNTPSWSVLKVINAKVIEPFGYPRASYPDNRKQFVEGVFPTTIKTNGVHMMFAPPGNPSLVGLAEAYVKLV